MTFQLFQLVGRRAVAFCLRPLASSVWRGDAYSLHGRPAATVQVNTATTHPPGMTWSRCELPCCCVKPSVDANFGLYFRLQHQVRYASGRKGFLGEFVDNLRQEFSKNQEMKDNIKRFREEAKKLEESDALQQARRKYVRTFSKFSSLELV